MEVRVQTWGDDLRLPCITDAATLGPLLSSVEYLRNTTVPFQSKHLHSLKRDIWYVLRRPCDRSRSGFLYVWSAQSCCVYISGEAPSAKRPTPRVALLRLRVDPQFFGDGVGPTVFAATLSAASRRLWIEDTLIWKGRPLTEDTFSTRWRKGREWLANYCLLDTRLLSDLSIEMASWTSLDSMTDTGVWELQPEGVGRKRMLWMENRGSPVLSSMPPPPEPVASVPVLDLAGPLIAVATREAGPEQWSLASADGSSLGRALIRTLAVSSELRSSKTARVEVVWAAEFKKWEILAVTQGMASHSSFFGTPS